MSRKANRRTTIDLSKISYIYHKLKDKYSKYSSKQLLKLENEHDNKPEVPNYYGIKDLINFTLINNKKYKTSRIKQRINGVVQYIPSNSRKKNVCFKNYKTIKELGAGAFGTAYLASKGSYKYAIKVLEIVIGKADMNWDNETIFRQEINISKKMGELGIGPKIYDAYYCKENNKYLIFIVQEYMKGGDLEQWLEDGNKFTSKLKLELKKKINLMHTNGFYHGDLHKNNILIQNKDGTNPELFLGDFGLTTSQKILNDINQQDDITNMRAILMGNDNIQNKDKRLHNLIINDIILNKLIKFRM
tara:strand:- start:618 stop:1526 length:909 start_codon:yes stop_codon:yes gene_type:complete